MARRRRSRAVVVACLALVLSLPGTATAAPGDLDPTFSGDGRVLTDFGSAFDSGNEMAQAPDGRLVVAGSTADETTFGDFAVARYNPDGSPDTTFGGDGRVTTDISGTGMQDDAYGVAVQPDRKVVVVGSSWKEYENCCWFTVVRYNENGTLDPTFGGDGVVTTDFGGGPNEAYEVVLRPDGRILAMGTSGGRFALAQFNPDGSRDTTFGGGDGEVTTDPRSTGTIANRATVAAMEQDPVPANNTATATTAVNNSRGCTIIGTSAGETIVGTNGNDVICGLGGNDTIRGGNGSDVRYGDVGNDNVDGGNGNGNDTLYGGAGNDTLTGSYGSDQLNTVDGVSGNDTANGGPDFDTCTTDSGDTRIGCP